MKTLITLFTLFFLCVGMTRANEQTQETILLEDKMDLFEKIVNMQVRLGMIQNSSFWNRDRKMNSMALVDTLWKKGWDSTTTEELLLVKDSLKKIDFNKFELADKVRLFLLDQKLGANNLVLNSKFMSDLYDEAKTGKLDRREIYTLLNYQDHLSDSGFGDILKEVTDFYTDDVNEYAHAEKSLRQSPQRTVLQDLVYHDMDPGEYDRGQYRFGPILYMFCRKDRNYPCMMFLKDQRNQLVRNPDGRIWTHRALGLARNDRPYNVKNGFTPSGVYTVDSVMPDANRQRVFGKYRRLILNFIPRTQSENRIKELLPESSHVESWWKQAVVARDIGRNLLRIHGTGLRNNNPSSSYYPFVKTSGCIAMRENKYNGVNYKDQRVLLDMMMKYSGYTPKYKNETNIRSLLYVVEVDNEKRPVEKEDIESILGIR